MYVNNYSIYLINMTFFTIVYTLPYTLCVCRLFYFQPQSHIPIASALECGASVLRSIHSSGELKERCITWTDSMVIVTRVNLVISIMLQGSSFFVR